MDSILKSDIFFVITAMAVIIIAILLIILISYLIRLARDIKQMADKAKKEANLIINDVDGLRQKAKSQAFLTAPFLNYFKQLRRKSKKK